LPEQVENYAKFWLEPIALVRAIGYNATDLQRLRKLVEEQRDLFLEKWDEYFKS